MKSMLVKENINSAAVGETYVISFDEEKGQYAISKARENGTLIHGPSLEFKTNVNLEALLAICGNRLAQLLKESTGHSYSIQNALSHVDMASRWLQTARRIEATQGVNPKPVISYKEVDTNKESDGSNAESAK